MGEDMSVPASVLEVDQVQAGVVDETSEALALPALPVEEQLGMVVGMLSEMVPEITELREQKNRLAEFLEASRKEKAEFKEALDKMREEAEKPKRGLEVVDIVSTIPSQEDTVELIELMKVKLGKKIIEMGIKPDDLETNEDKPQTPQNKEEMNRLACSMGLIDESATGNEITYYERHALKFYKAFESVPLKSLLRQSINWARFARNGEEDNVDIVNSYILYAMFNLLSSFGKESFLEIIRMGQVVTSLDIDKKSAFLAKRIRVDVMVSEAPIAGLESVIGFVKKTVAKQARQSESEQVTEEE
ncbi:hypothetical protein DRH14_03715 [Candidatus Shapirobacteria bacterium]|nr:MAG: hypothetical protein DRH14_03715 [Candidatus Shapirobacteria bacterium]